MGDDSPLLKGGKASSRVSTVDLERGSVCNFEKVWPLCLHVEQCNLH